MPPLEPGGGSDASNGGRAEGGGGVMVQDGGRLLEAYLEPLQDMPPITGILTAPLRPLTDAVKVLAQCNIPTWKGLVEAGINTMTKRVGGCP